MSERLVQRLFCVVVSLLATVVTVEAAEESPSREEIRAALGLLDPEDRPDAALFVVDAEGRRRIRQGRNDQICEIDRRRDTRFTASCHHDSLEPYLSRSRALAADGLGAAAIRETLGLAFEAGELDITSGAYQIYASGSRPEPGVLPDEVTVYHLIYLPMTAADAVGLPSEDRGELPWLHNAGTVDSHVMWSQTRPIEH